MAGLTFTFFSISTRFVHNSRTPSHPRTRTHHRSSHHSSRTHHRPSHHRPASHHRSWPHHRSRPHHRSPHARMAKFTVLCPTRWSIPAWFVHLTLDLGPFMDKKTKLPGTELAVTARLLELVLGVGPLLFVLHSHRDGLFVLLYSKFGTTRW